MATSAAAAAPATPALDLDSAAVVALTEVSQTSVATRGIPPGEVTVQFRRFTTHGMTAYQKGQHAGFMLPIAEGLVRSGHAVIITERVPVAGRMVTK